MKVVYLIKLKIKKIDKRELDQSEALINKSNKK